jgi:hypothetical protein
VHLNGPTGVRLGRDGIVRELPNVDFDLGIIAGMKDHIVLLVTHTFMMNNAEVLNQALHFFQNGYFRKE